MRDRRYQIVILDSHGRSQRHLSVSRRLLVSIGAVVVIGVVGAVLAAAHGLSQVSAAREARELTHDNAELERLVSNISTQMPALRVIGSRVDISFLQVWAKSGLGAEPTALGVGPLGDRAAFPEGAPAILSRRVLEASPVDLSLEVDRIYFEGRTLNRTLAEQVEYFHDAERLLSNTPSIKPAHSPWLTSGFGKRRDPVFGVWMMHKGIDLGGFIGQEIFAPADGTVIFAGTRGGYGRTIVVDHGYGLQTHFAHLSAFKVQEGERVRRGELIALMGTTGKSTGPHLHYEVRRWGQPLNPAPFVLD